MRHVLVVVLLLAACERDHRVDLILGPTESSPSVGFRCVSDGGLLLAPAFAAGTVNVVVDVIDVGGANPSCRGEDIALACAGKHCGPLVSLRPTRFCEPLTLTGITDAAAATNAAYALLDRDAHQLVVGAPAHSVLFRVVLTQQPCSSVEVASPSDPTMWSSLEGAKALGCAYSCPEVLDNVDGPLSLGLDVFDVNDPSCTPTVRACAAFP